MTLKSHTKATTEGKRPRQRRKHGCVTELVNRSRPGRRTTERCRKRWSWARLCLMRLTCFTIRSQIGHFPWCVKKTRIHLVCYDSQQEKNIDYRFSVLEFWNSFTWKHGEALSNKNQRNEKTKPRFELYRVIFIVFYPFVDYNVYIYIRASRVDCGRAVFTVWLPRDENAREIMSIGPTTILLLYEYVLRVILYLVPQTSRRISWLPQDNEMAVFNDCDRRIKSRNTVTDPRVFVWQIIITRVKILNSYTHIYVCVLDRKEFI